MNEILKEIFPSIKKYKTITIIKNLLVHIYLKNELNKIMEERYFYYIQNKKKINNNVFQLDA